MSELSPANQCPTCGAALPANAPQGLCPKCLLLDVAAPTEPGEAGAPPATAAPRPAPPSPEVVTAAFPQLDILELIGQGGMGCVFKARQPQLNRFVALKILPEALSRDAAFAARFTREAQALAALNHPNIVTIHDFGFAPSTPASSTFNSQLSTASGGFFYLLMEYVDGVNLRQALRAGHFTPEEALAIVPPLCDALQFAHDRGIVHRDIKPENLLLDKAGRIKIADFGIAKLVGPVAEAEASRRSNPTNPTHPALPRLPTLTGATAAGTPGYMAPEQQTAPHKVDRRADIYSLGVVFYEMLTGELPADKLQPPSRKVTIDVRIDEIVLRTLEREPERRYQQASEVKTAVETLSHLPSAPSTAQPQKETATVTARSRWFAPLVVVRNRERVIHWPGVAQDAFMLAGIFGVAWSCAAMLLTPVWGMPPLGSLIGGAVGFVGAMLGLGIYRSWRRPVERMAQTPPSAGSQASSTATADPTSPPQTPPRLSRVAIAGAAWIGLFFLNWIASYTPPGWALTALLRDTIGNAAEGLLFSGPMMVLGFAALPGATVLGIVALRQIRQSHATLGGVGLALFDVLFFPMLFLNGWIVWLGHKVLSEMSRTGFVGSAPAAPGAGWTWAVIPISFVALALSAVAVRAAWHTAHKFVNTPPPPTSPPTVGTWAQACRSAGLRFLLLAVVQLALLETLNQVSAGWKESSGELWSMALAVASLAGLVWVFWPGFRLKRSAWFVVGGTVAAAFVLLGLNYYFAWHLRPNLGLYRDDGWAEQHPGFLCSMRLQVARNLWKRPVAPPFAAATEFTLSATNGQNVTLFDLDTNRQMGRSGFDEKNDEDCQWARTEGFDLVAGWKKGKCVFVGLNLEAVSAFKETWDAARSQNVADFWLLDRKPESGSVRLAWDPRWPNLHYIRTREGRIGLLQIVGHTNELADATLRWKLVASAKDSAARSIVPVESEALRTAKARLVQLRARFTDEHPTVKALLAQIRELEQKDRDAAQTPSGEK
ncbi:MAG: protein kinase [Verrucomicrobia bacterium]|nr:protein kinase [Verrucomicrobiota bacterium]